MTASPPDDGPGDPTPVTVRVLVVDDHEVLGGSLAVVLDSEDDLETTGVATTIEQAAQMLVSTAPDVMLLDHRLPDGDGIAAIPRLLALRPEVKIVVLTASAPDHLLLAAIEAGAYGFLSKSRSVDEVSAAVRAAAAGESVISPSCWPGSCRVCTAVVPLRSGPI